MDPLRLQNKTNSRSISGRASGLGSKKQQRFSIKLLSVFFNFLSTKATYSQSSFYFKNSINFSMLNLGVSFFMFFFNYSIDFLYPKVLSGQKGFTLKYTSNIVTPKLHTSTLLVNLLFSSKRISGAQYKGVPDMLQSYYFSQDTPKSLILQTLSFLIIFSGFMSRCIIFLLCIDLSPSQTSQRTLMSSAWEISRLASIQFLREHSPSSNTMQASLSIFLGQGQIYSQPMYWMTNLLPSNSFCIRISASTISLMMGSLQFFTIFNAQLLLRLSFARQTAAAPPSPMIPQILYSTPAITIFSFIIFKQYLQLQSTKIYSALLISVILSTTGLPFQSVREFNIKCLSGMAKSNDRVYFVLVQQPDPGHTLQRIEAVSNIAAEIVQLIRQSILVDVLVLAAQDNLHIHASSMQILPQSPHCECEGRENVIGAKNMALPHPIHNPVLQHLFLQLIDQLNAISQLVLNAGGLIELIHYVDALPEWRGYFAYFTNFLQFSHVLPDLCLCEILMLAFYMPAKNIMNI